MAVAYEKIFSRGTLGAVESTPITDGKFRLATDSEQLFVDYKEKRIEISDIVKGYTVAEIKAITDANIHKVYLASDTLELWYYSDGWYRITNGKTSDKVLVDVRYETSENGFPTLVLIHADGSMTNVEMPKFIRGFSYDRITHQTLITYSDGTVETFDMTQEQKKDDDDNPTEPVNPSTQTTDDSNASTETSDDNASTQTTDDNASTQVDDSNASTEATDDNASTQTTDDNASTQVDDSNASTEATDDNASTQTEEDNASTQIDDSNTSTETTDENASTETSEDNSSTVVDDTTNASTETESDNSSTATTDDNASTVTETSGDNASTVTEITDESDNNSTVTEEENSSTAVDDSNASTETEEPAE